MRFHESRFRGVPGFQMFDELVAQAELDARSGPQVRRRSGRFELNRPAADVLIEACKLPQLSSLKHRGLMLGFDAERMVAAVTVAPVECPPGVRLSAAVWGDPVSRSGLTAEWPVSVASEEFMQFHRLVGFMNEARATRVARALEFRCWSTVRTVSMGVEAQDGVRAV